MTQEKKKPLKKSNTSSAPKEVQEKFKEDLEASKEQVLKVKKKLEASKGKVENVKKKLAKSKEKVSDLKKELAFSKEQVSQVQKELTGFKQQATQLKHDLSLSKKSEPVSEEQVSGLKKRLAHSEEKVFEYEKKLLQSQTYVETVRKKIEDESVSPQDVPPPPPPPPLLVDEKKEERSAEDLDDAEDDQEGEQTPKSEEKGEFTQNEGSFAGLITENEKFEGETEAERFLDSEVLREDLGDFSSFLPEEGESFQSRWAWVKKHLKLFSLGFFLFLVITYFAFPYGLVNQWIVLNVSHFLSHQNSSFRVRIESFRPHWVTGLRFQGVKVINTQNAQEGDLLAFDELRFYLAPWALLWGKLNVSAFIQDSESGTLNFDVILSILDLIGSKMPLKSSSLKLSQFVFGEFLQMGIHALKDIQNPNMLLVKPLLDSMNVSGQADGHLSLKRDQMNLIQAQGKIRFPNLVFDMTDETLNIPKQTFPDSQVSFLFKNGDLILNEETKFESEDFGLNLSGQIKLPQAQEPGSLNLDMTLKMLGAVKDNFSVLNTVLGCRDFDEKGILKARLFGPLRGLPKCE